MSGAFSRLQRGEKRERDLTERCPVGTLEVTFDAYVSLNHRVRFTKTFTPVEALSATNAELESRMLTSFRALLHEYRRHAAPQPAQKPHPYVSDGLKIGGAKAGKKEIG